VLLGMNEKKTPVAVERYFGRHASQLLAVIVVAGVVGALSPVEALAKRSRVERKVQLRREVLTELGVLLAKAQLACPGLDLGDPGLHVWRPRRSLRHPLAGSLRRVGFFRLGTTPVTVRFEPVRGVGVVGLCWRDDAVKAVDVEALATRLHTEALFDAEVASCGADAVMGLSWEKFNDVKHRGAVFAAPIRGRRGFIGCVSVDVSRGHDALVAQGLPAFAAGVAAKFGPADFDIF